MNRKLLQFIITSTIFLQCACSTMPPAERITTTVATHAYVVAGQGSPTVVLEAGLGSGKESWAPVFNGIAETTQVFAYNRAGYPPSRSGDGMRDAATIVAELRASLQALDLKPPYVLVGHSVGGTYMELFARLYPEEVAGAVLVDSRHADFTRQCKLADAGACEPPALILSMMPPGPKREMDSAAVTMRQVRNAGPFPQVPLVVLTGGKQILTSEAFYSIWLATQEQLAELGDNPKHVVCERCGHFVQRDDPALVINAVSEVVSHWRMRSRQVSAHSQ